MTTFADGPWITRFAPSPTGIPHLGNMRTAILNFLLARQSGGKFLLRLEDTDRERSTFAAEAGILWSLAWLGLTPDEPARHQSLRRDLYTRAVRDLVERDRAYPCFCSEERLEQDRQEAAVQGLPPRYSGRCTGLTPDEVRARIAAGEPHVVRFRCPDSETVQFKDLIKGDMSVPASAFGDFVLLRSSGWPSYNLAVVVDDMDMGVNLVLRGEDHLTNTARQILLYRAFGATPPSFAHHGLLVDTEGKKLSKRTGALSIPECMDMGLTPLAVAQYLASLSGALPGKKQHSSLEEMARAFNPFALGRGNAVMNLDELHALSARLFRATAPDELVVALRTVVSETDAWHGLDADHQLELATSLRENAASLSDLRSQLPYFTTDAICFTAEAVCELHSAAPVLNALDQALALCAPASRLSKDTAGSALRQTGDQAGVKGRQLYHPIRLALTGSAAGPDLTALLTLLSVGQIRQRLQAALFSQCNHKE